ncbi:MAG: squalene synthase HpnC [Rhodospirillaceae bacterium]|jgi:hydroxysqualene synthase|nr:squalene synthase HpnC [Rhodospirillaceae bacterium]
MDRVAETARGKGASGTGPSSQAFETPSGKGAGDENFPVGSWLLPARLRPHVAVFYRFARAIDDIADNPDLTPDDKLMRLEAFEAAILGRDTEHPGLATAHRMRDSLYATGVPERHCIDLIAAFKQDAVKNRYADWADLMGYCFLSAAPVGRYLLDLHGESREGYRHSDALCNALQVINHLQDCQDDYRALDRVYLPGDWMAAEGVTVEDLDSRRSSAGLRRVLDRCLDATADLMIEARELPGALTDRRLAMESAAIVAMADRLIVKLRRQDPVAERVELSKPAFLACFATGVWRGLKR